MLTGPHRCRRAFRSLVVYLTDQIFQCHDATYGAIFIDDNRTLQFSAAQLGKQLIDLLVLRHEERLVGNLVQPCLHPVVGHRVEQVTKIDDPVNIVPVLFEQRNLGHRPGQDLWQCVGDCLTALQREYLVAGRPDVPGFKVDVPGFKVVEGEDPFDDFPLPAGNSLLLFAVPQHTDQFRLGNDGVDRCAGHVVDPGGETAENPDQRIDQAHKCQQKRGDRQ